MEKIIFCDEKVFTVEKEYNPQNTRVYAVHMEDIAVQHRTIPRIQKPPSVIVWGAVLSLGKVALHFIPPGTTLNRF